MKTGCGNRSDEALHEGICNGAREQGTSKRETEQSEFTDCGGTCWGVKDKGRVELLLGFHLVPTSWVMLVRRVFQGK